MDVLKDERKRAFAQISASRLTDGAGGRIGPEGFVVRAAIVVTGKPKSARRPQDQQGCRHGRPRWPPARPRSEPGVSAAKNFRRVERREVWPEAVVVALKCTPRRVDDEQKQSAEREKRLHPPPIASRSLPEPSSSERNINGGQFCGAPSVIEIPTSGIQNSISLLG